MKKNKQHKLLAVLILLLVFAMLAGRHFSARRLRPVVPVTPAPDLPLPERTQETQPVPPVEKAQPAEQLPVSAVVEEPEEQEPDRPEWFNNMLALHESYYPSWLAGRTVAHPDAGRGGPAAHSSQGSGTAGSSGQRVVAPSAHTSSAPSADRQAVSRRRSDADVRTDASPTSQPRALPYGSGRDGTGVPGVPDNGGSPGEGNGDNGTEQPPGRDLVTVSRAINPGSDVTYVTLDIDVQSDVSGLIITESLSSGYSITSSSPRYSKKTGDTYSWLIWGRTVPSQEITYQVKGSGSGSITGEYKSTGGSGAISGSSSLP